MMQTKTTLHIIAALGVLMLCFFFHEEIIDGIQKLLIMIISVIGLGIIMFLVACFWQTITEEDIERQIALKRKEQQEAEARQREIDRKYQEKIEQKRAEEAALQEAIAKARQAIAQGQDACMKCGTINPPRCGFCNCCISGKRLPDGDACSPNYYGYCPFCED